jgi:sec-independent protein translocase protein TatA
LATSAAPLACVLLFEAEMFGVGMPELMVTGIIVLLLFGNRLPSVMRSLGVGITEFKKGLHGEELPDPKTPLEDKRREEV